MPDSVFTAEQRDALQEIANLAMGRAAARLAVLLPCTNLDEALQVADKVRDAIGRTTVDAEGVSVAVTASVGAACAKLGQPACDALVNDADAALYRAKRLGRDRSVGYA